MKTERRFSSAVKLRAYDPDGDSQGDEAQRDIGGYAATFNTETVIWDYFRERLAVGCFTDAIKNCDVRALFNHDPNFVIGRNTSNTLTLSEDATGLAWRAQPPKTTWARDLAVSIDRGDISGCSFAFIPTVEEWDYSGDMPLRTIVACDLYDVSAVTYPQYDETSVGNLRAIAQETLSEARAKAAALVAGGPLGVATRSRLDRKRALLDRLTNRA